MWPVDGYGEGVLWDLKRVADGLIREPIVNAIGAEELSSDANPGVWEQSLRDTGEYGGVHIDGDLIDPEAFYGLLTQCGGAIAIRNQILDATVKPALPDSERQFELEQPGANVSLSLEATSTVCACVRKGRCWR